jgi:hypothetical protein
VFSGSGVKCLTIQNSLTSNIAEENMRFLFTVIFLIASIIVFTSCNKNSGPLSPNDESGITSPDYAISYFYSPIILPERAPLFQDSVYTINKEINGDAGGSISYSNYFISAEGDSISFEFDIDFPESSFVGNENITVTLDNEYAALHFYPHLIFNKDVKLTQQFKGLNLDGMSNQTIDFVFMDDNGNVEVVRKNGIQVIVPQRLVRVMNAKLKHFSRYGWVRKTARPIVIEAE